MEQMSLWQPVCLGFDSRALCVFNYCLCLWRKAELMAKLPSHHNVCKSKNDEDDFKDRGLVIMEVTVITGGSLAQLCDNSFKMAEIAGGRSIV